MTLARGARMQPRAFIISNRVLAYSEDDKAVFNVGFYYVGGDRGVKK